MVTVPRMLLIPGGTFGMGKDSSRADEGPAHPVTLSAFLAAESPVSNAEYAEYILASGASVPPFAAEERFANPQQPVVGVNWFEATAYCEWLSTDTSSTLRLPTEAEREFAALGGLVGVDWPWDEAATDFVAWVNSLEAPHIPGPACANGYGLRCMAENVHEWCLDWYDPKYYNCSPRDNPKGPAEGKRRASRGGSWRHREKTTRINARSSLVPEFQYSDFGFRVYSSDVQPSG
jgi:formylglycine-generating enzyme required for sulfatase activity